MTEKRFQYNVNKNSIEYDGKHFAYCNGEQSKIAKKLNELHEENQAIKKQILEPLWTTEHIRNLEDENKELKESVEELNEICKYYEMRIKELTE